MDLHLDDDPGPAPTSFPLPDGWRVEAEANVRRFVGLILAAVPRLVNDPDILKDTAMRNVRAKLVEAAPDIDPALIKSVRDAGYSLADYHEAVAIHYAHMIDVEIDRILVERKSA